MFRKTKRNIIGRIIEDNLDYLVRFAFYRLGNREEAEDLVHDAVLKCLEKSPDDLKPESIRLYLFKIVYNLCQDRGRIKKKVILPIDTIEIEDKPEDVLDAEDADRINSCLDRLPEREAEVIRMNVVDNLSFVEISAILSIPQSTAKSRYKSGMDKLRKQLSTDKMS